MNDVIIGVTVGTSISPEKIKEIAGNADPSAEEQKIIAALLKYLEENPPQIAEKDPTVPDWAKEKTKPSYSKSEVGLGDVDNVRQYSASNPPPYPVASVNGQTGKVQLSAADVEARPSNWMPTAQEVGALPDTYVPPNQTAAQVGADPAGTAAAAVSAHNTSPDSHGDLRLELKAISDRLTAFFDSDNQTLDELSEIVAYITSNKALIDSITTSKVSVADIINNLTTNVANKPLSAAQGVALKGLIDAVSNSLSNYQPKGDYALRSELPTVPTKVSQLQNDKGYLTEHQDISGKLDADKLPEAVNTALAQAKESGEFDGEKGDPGVTPHIGANGNWYIGSDDTGVKAQGNDGTSVTVKSVSESTADGGGNVVEFTDGKTLTVKNGKQGSPGKTPVRGVDYYTEAEKAEFSEYIASELAKRGQLKPEFANSIEECTDTTKLYVLPDGFIYAYMLTEKEVETGGGYTNALDGTTKHINERWSHSGKKYSTGANGYMATDKLPVSADQTVYVNLPQSAFNGNYPRIHYFDASGNYVTTLDSPPVRAHKLTTDANGVTSWVVGYQNTTAGDDSTNARLANADSITHMLIVFDISWYLTGADGTAITEDDCKEIIVSIGNPIEEGGTEIVKEWTWTSTGHAFVPADYEGRIVDLETLTETHSKDIANLKKGVANVTAIKEWDAPIYDANIPVFQLSAEKAAMTNATNTPDNIYAMYDALMAKHPKYITKTDMGLCSDGINHVYRYDFREPEPHYESGKVWSETKAKAIIITGIHYEWAAIYSMYYALEEIADNPELRNFRRNIHLIVVPVSNPYATIASNYSASMGVKNANGVEIHRNFEVDFKYPTDSGYVAEGELHHGGTAPLSEVETQYIDGIMKNNTDAAVFLSCHNYDGATIWGTGFIWSSTATKYMCNLGFRLVDKLSDAWMDKYGDVLTAGIEEYKTDLLEDGDARLGWAGLSTSAGTESKQATKYGIQGTNVEISHKFLIHGTADNPEPAMSSFTMSRGAEVYVNFLLTAFGVYDPKDKKEYSV